MKDTTSEVDIGASLGIFFTLMWRYASVLVLATFGLAALDTALQLGLGKGANYVGSVVSIVVVFAVLRYLLRNEGMVEEEGGFASYFRASLLSGLGVLIGFILLVVPGFYLLARWSIAPALVITRGYNASDALRASWDATRSSAWTLVVVYLVAIAIAVGGAFLIGFSAALATNARSPVLVGITQLFGDFAAIAGAYLTVSIYMQLVRGGSELEEVFG